MIRKENLGAAKEAINKAILNGETKRVAKEAAKDSNHRAGAAAILGSIAGGVVGHQIGKHSKKKHTKKAGMNIYLNKIAQEIEAMEKEAKDPELNDNQKAWRIYGRGVAHSAGRGLAEGAGGLVGGAAIGGLAAKAMKLNPVIGAATAGYAGLVGGQLHGGLVGGKNGVKKGIKKHYLDKQALAGGSIADSIARGIRGAGAMAAKGSRSAANYVKDIPADVGRLKNIARTAGTIRNVSGNTGLAKAIVGNKAFQAGAGVTGLAAGGAILASRRKND